MYDFDTETQGRGFYNSIPKPDLSYTSLLCITGDTATHQVFNLHPGMWWIEAILEEKTGSLSRHRTSAGSALRVYPRTALQRRWWTTT